jgi:hypothetical protein
MELQRFPKLLLIVTGRQSARRESEGERQNQGLIDVLPVVILKRKSRVVWLVKILKGESREIIDERAVLEGHTVSLRNL